MNSVNINIIESKNLSNKSSKYLGLPSIPQSWIEDENLFDEDDMFLCQINLEDLSNFNVPTNKVGILYFFINLKTEQGKVLYSKENDNLVKVDFNDGLINSSREFKIYFDVNEEVYLDGTKFLGTPVDNYSFNEKEEVLLLQIDTLQENNIFKNNENIIYQYIIKKEDFVRNKFSNVRLDIIEV